jgi:hypothetical protein
MSKKRQRKQDDQGEEEVESPLRAMLGGGRTALVMVAVVAAMGIGGWWLWQRVGPQVLADQQYQLDPAQIEITPPPAWIRADVRAEVVRDGSLDSGVSMLESELARQIADAFALHPWVAEVKEVQLEYPGGAKVALVYRKPVAVAKIEGSSNLELYPFSAAGVRLPESDLTPAEKRRIPRLAGVTALPVVGSAASDPIVIGGSRLADLLLADWESLRLAKIVPAPPADTRQSGAPIIFELTALNGARVIWGPAPVGSPDAGATTRLEQLRELAQAPGGIAPQQIYDLRQTGKAKTARAGENRPD